MDDRSRRIIFFTRGPRLDARAKRLSRPAVGLFRALARSWAVAAKRVGAVFEVCGPAEAEVDLRGTLAGFDIVFEAQTGAGFAERLGNVAASVQRASGPVLIVGGDVPPPAPAILERAFAHLGEPGGVVLEPSPDGGVNLIGLDRPHDELFVGVPWGTDRVHLELVARIQAERMPLLELEPRLDIDSLDAARIASSASDQGWSQFASELAALLADSPAFPATVVLSSGGPFGAVVSASRAPPAEL